MKISGESIQSGILNPQDPLSIGIGSCKGILEAGGWLHVLWDFSTSHMTRLAIIDDDSLIQSRAIMIHKVEINGSGSSGGNQGDDEGFWGGMSQVDSKRHEDRVGDLQGLNTAHVDIKWEVYVARGSLVRDSTSNSRHRHEAIENCEKKKEGRKKRIMRFRFWDSVHFSFQLFC